MSATSARRRHLHPARLHPGVRAAHRRGRAPDPADQDRGRRRNGAAGHVAPDCSGSSAARCSSCTARSTASSRTTIPTRASPEPAGPDGAGARPQRGPRHRLRRRWRPLAWWTAAAAWSGRPRAHAAGRDVLMRTRRRHPVRREVLAPRRHLRLSGGGRVMWKSATADEGEDARDRRPARRRVQRPRLLQGALYGFDDALYAAARLLEVLASESRTPDELFDDLRAARRRRAARRLTRARTSC